MPAITFHVVAALPSGARAGTIQTPHGPVRTPVFMPVGTQASVKALTPDELRALGAEIILGNAYHLYLRPGPALVAEFGGLHSFMNWDRAILTDSGGFQVFSLGFGLEHGVGKIAKMFPAEGDKPAPPRPRDRLTKVDEDGVTFTSHIDGSRHRFTPESSIAIQQQLGADIILAFDECTSPLSSYDYTVRALDRTHRWAVRSLAAKTNDHQALFGIIQGGEYRELRERSTDFIASLPFEGYAVGGSLGKSKQDMHRVLEWTCPRLPAAKPRHLLGIGDPVDMFECIERGIDMFDCVAPARLGRHAVLYTPAGRLNIKNQRYRIDHEPILPGCGCYTCRHFSRGYLRHLFVAGELLAYRLATIHNVHFLVDLVQQIRASIVDGTFPAFKAAWLARWGDGRLGAGKAGSSVASAE